MTWFRFGVLRRNRSVGVRPVRRVDPLAGHGGTTEPRILRRVEARADVRRRQRVVPRPSGLPPRRRAARLERSRVSRKIPASTRRRRRLGRFDRDAAGKEKKFNLHLVHHFLSVASK